MARGPLPGFRNKNFPRHKSTLWKKFMFENRSESRENLKDYPLCPRDSRPPGPSDTTLVCLKGPPETSLSHACVAVDYRSDIFYSVDEILGRRILVLLVRVIVGRVWAARPPYRA